MKTYMPLNGLWWSRDSGSANCDMPQSAVLGRPGGRGLLVDSRTGYSFVKIKWGFTFFCLPFLK